MSEITVRQLEYFLAVVDHGSISSSARALHISQAAVSLALQQLEKNLNAKLLRRSPARRATTTTAGDSLIPYARAVLTSVKEATHAVKDHQTRMQGLLKVELPASISPYIIPPLVAHYAQHYPRVDIEVTENNPSELYDRVTKGIPDVAIFYKRQLHAGLPSEYLFEVRPHVIVASNHPLADRSFVHLRELIDEPLIPINNPPSMERIVDSIQGLGLYPTISWPSSNTETVRSLVAQNLGWSFVNIVPTSTTTFDGSEVRYIPIADALSPNSLVAAYPPHSIPSTKVTTAIKFLRDFFAARPHQHHYSS